jgi:hypothetical protein
MGRTTRAEQGGPRETEGHQLAYPTPVAAPALYPTVLHVRPRPGQARSPQLGPRHLPDIDLAPLSNSGSVRSHTPCASLMCALLR